MYVKYVQHNKISNKLLVSRFQPTIEILRTRIRVLVEYAMNRTVLSTWYHYVYR
jgi:hypothetical protein